MFQTRQFQISENICNSTEDTSSDIWLSAHTFHIIAAIVCKYLGYDDILDDGRNSDASRTREKTRKTI